MEAGSSALETRMNRGAVERLSAGRQTLSAILAPQAYNSAGFQPSLGRNVLLYSETPHGGAWNSVFGL